MKRFVKFIDNIEQNIGTVLLIFMCILATLQVFTRHVLQNSLSWTEELSRYSYMYFCLITASYATKEKGQISIDIIQLVLNRQPKLSKIICRIGDYIWLAFSLFMVYIGIGLVYRTIVSGETTPALSIPKYWIYIIEPLGFAMMGTRIVQILFKDAKASKGQLETQ